MYHDSANELFQAFGKHHHQRQRYYRMLSPPLRTMFARKHIFIMPAYSFAPPVVSASSSAFEPIIMVINRRWNWLLICSLVTNSGRWRAIMVKIIA